MSNRRAQRPLDPAATAAANEAVFAEMDRRGEPRRRLTMSPDDYEYRKRWMDAYTAAGGAVEEPRPAAPPKRPADPCNQVTRVVVKIESVQFKSDHALLRDHTADWRKAGTRFEDKDKREWTKDHSFPISHTKQEQVDLIATFDVLIEGAPSLPAEVHGNGGQDALRFEGAATLRTGKVSVTLKSKGKLPDEVTKQGGKSIQWTVTCKAKTYEAGASTPHTLYVTIGRPNEAGGEPEAGVTLRRMEQAVEWVGEAWRQGKRQPVEIVEHLFGKFPGYILGFHHMHPRNQKYFEDHPDEKAKLEAVDFAGYDLNNKRNQGGAWPLAEHHQWSGECQAIVRLISGILKQVGCPGKAEPKFVNADARRPKTAIIRDNGTRCTGPDASKGYALVDKPVRVGELYDDTSGVGWNNYEAYMKFTHNREVAWFGGGMGRIPDGADPLLTAFYGLAEYESVLDGGSRKRKVTSYWPYR